MSSLKRHAQDIMGVSGGVCELGRRSKRRTPLKKLLLQIYYLIYCLYMFIVL